MLIRKVSLSSLKVLRIKKKEESWLDNLVGHRFLKEENENVILWHDTTK